MGRDAFVKNLAEIKIRLTDGQLAAFDRYYELLTEWNSFMNLTGITEYDQVLLKHFVDSLAVNKIIEKEDILKIKLTEPLKVIDVGTGAGFPGVPLKIAFPDLKMTLLDSLNKRIKFLNEVIRSLELSETEAVHGRAEEFAILTGYRESFDLCVSRAVSHLAVLSEYCIPYVKTGGYFISFKSGEIEEEAKEASRAIEVLGGKIMRIAKTRLPDSEIDRSYVIIQKIKKTSGKYPRKPGTPSKEPIK